MQFIKDHPIAATSGALVGGGAGYGLTHHFLDFETPYALGAGALGAAAGFYVTKSAFDAADFVAKPLKAAAAAVSDATQVVSTGVTAAADAVSDKKIWAETGNAIVNGTVLTDVAIGLGIYEDPGEIDVDYWLKHGTPKQKAAAKNLAEAMRNMTFVKGPKDPDARARFEDAIKKMQAAMAEASNTGNEDDAMFTTNNDNPVNEQQPIVMTLDEPPIVPPTVKDIDAVLKRVDKKEKKLVEKILKFKLQYVVFSGGSSTSKEAYDQWQAILAEVDKKKIA